MKPGLCILPLILCWTVSGRPALADETLIEQVKQAIIKDVNAFRKKNELSAVEVNAELAETALKFAKFMAESDKFGHRADGSTPAQRATESGYEYCVIRENIAYRLNTGEVTAANLIDAFVQGWIDSPSHRENMLADFVTQTGVAVATTDGKKYYAVQLFGRPKSVAIRVKVSNQLDETRTLVLEANDSSDEIELPAHSVATITRCFPTKLRLKQQAAAMQLNESTELVISQAGLEKQ